MTIESKDKRLFTMSQTQAMLELGRTRMWALIASGEIESVRIGRSRRIPVEAIDRYVEGLRASQQTEDPPRRVFRYSLWDYQQRYPHAPNSHPSVLTCTACDDAVDPGYIMASTQDEVEDLVNTNPGQLCGDCLADFLSAEKYSIGPARTNKDGTEGDR